MLTNAHILAINQHIVMGQHLLCQLAESEEKQLFMQMFADMCDHTFALNSDISDLRRKLDEALKLVAELRQQLYEPVVEAQASKKSCALLTDQCHKENKVDEVESELYAACQGPAVLMWRTLRTNEALGYVAAKNRNASVIYDMLKERFGELPYNKRNFRDARNKK